MKETSLTVIKKIRVEPQALLWYNPRTGMSLDKLRQEIDSIDAQLVELLKQRAACVHQVGEIKKSTGAPTFVPERECALIEKILKLNNDVLPEKSILSIWRQIVSCSFHLEGNMRIGYLGPEGTWSHQAALSRFGDSVELVPYASFDHVFSAVERGEVNYGVIPLENSTHGSVVQAMDIFAHTTLRICAQVHQAVQNCLMANIPASEIRAIYSHPQVLGQCSQWLQANYPHADQIPTASTTAAARMALEKKEEGAAALGSPLAARLHGLNVLAEHIQDIATNTTRFVVIGTQTTKPSGHDRTTICFTVPNKSGSLVDVLEHFRTHGINIFCLDSRPGRDRAWEYLFYIDVDGHEDQEPLRSCLAELKEQCPVLKVLGSYPEK